jgi:hypothetical protein
LLAGTRAVRKIGEENRWRYRSRKCNLALTRIITDHSARDGFSRYTYVFKDR